MKGKRNFVCNFVSIHSILYFLQIHIYMYTKIYKTNVTINVWTFTDISDTFTQLIA